MGAARGAAQRDKGEARGRARGAPPGGRRRQWVAKKSHGRGARGVFLSVDHPDSAQREEKIETRGRAEAPGGAEETREGRGIEGGKMGSREMASGAGAPSWRREQGVKEEGNERDKPRVREPGWA